MEIQNSDLHPTILSRSFKCDIRFQNHENAAQSLLSFSKDNESEYASSSLSDFPNMEKSSNHRSSLDFILNSTNENSESYDKDLESGNDFESHYSSEHELEYSLDNQPLNHPSFDIQTIPSPISFPLHQGFGNIHRLSHPSLSGFVTVNASHSSQHSMHHHLPIHGCNISNHSSVEMKSIMPRYSFQHHHISTLPARHIISSQYKNIALHNSSKQDSIICSQSSQNIKTLDSSNIDIKKDLDIHKDSQKRKRLNSSQSTVLKGVFEYTYFPSTELRKRLAQQLGLTPRTIQIWFQNKRQNWRNRSKLKEQKCISSVSQHQRLQLSEIPGSYSSLQSPQIDSPSIQQLVFSNVAPRDIQLQRLRREDDVYILSKPEVMEALSCFRSSNTENFIDQAFKLKRG